MRTSAKASILTLAATALLLPVSIYAGSSPSDRVRTCQTIQTFQTSSNPGAFVQAADGSFYGVTRYGRTDGYGTVYHVDTSGNYLTLHVFSPDTGAYPSLLVLAADGRIYGGSPGLNNLGSVYRIESNGNFQLLHEFTGGADGAYPNSLVAASDGSVYGFAFPAAGGPGAGSFFRILPDGTFEIIRALQASDDIAYPAGLVEAGNGELYGYNANLFRISKQGAATILHTFPTGAGTGGLQPDSLTAGTDGNIYGTTPGYYWMWHGSVIANNPGSVFRCTPAGEFKELHSFSHQQQGHPLSMVVQADNGNLYGAFNSQFYRVGVGGQFDVFYSFAPRQPSFLLRGVNGDIYGTNTGTWTNPAGDGGVLFRVVFGEPGSVNLSSRTDVGTGDAVAIGGFIITGDAAKKVMLRGIGPSLASQLSGSLSDPLLELHDSSGVIIARNDDWRTTQVGGLIAGDQSAEIQASGLAPGAEHESALIATLEPGNYTAVVSGNQNGTGIGLFEIYDLEIESNSRLDNISTRGFVETGNNVMIGGLIVDGSLYSYSNFVFRAIGPSLSQIGTSNPLQDPSLVIRNADGAQVAMNDNWRDGQESQLVSLGLAPVDDRESALYVSLRGGSYTAIISGRDGATGVALVEVYNVP